LVLSPYFSTDSTLFAGTNGSVYKSTDRGTTWFRSNSGIRENNYRRLAVTKKAGAFVLFCSTWGGNLYRSDNRGQTWYPCSSSLPDNNIAAIAPSPDFAQDSILFIGTGGWAYPGSVYRSTDGGRSWVDIGPPLHGKYVTEVRLSPNFIQDSVIFVGTEDAGVYGSFNAGRTWAQLNNGLTQITINHIAISPAFSTDSTAFLTECDNDQAVYRTLNGGRSWQRMLNAFSSEVVLSPNFRNDGEAFVGTYDVGLYKSADHGTTWMSLGGPYFNVWSIGMSPGYATDGILFTGHGNAGGIFYSSDRGSTWQSRCNGLSAIDVASIGVEPSFQQLPCLFVSPDYWAGPFRTTDGGSTWQVADSGLMNKSGFSFSLSPGVASDLTLFFAVWYDGVYRSKNLGNSWVLCDSGFPPPGSRYVFDVACSPSFVSDSVVFACMLDSAARKSHDAASFWQPCSGSPYVTDNRDLVFSPSFVSDHTVYMIQFPSILVMSTDGGNTWQRRDNGLSGYLYKMAISPDFSRDSTLMVIDNYGAVFRSTDRGLSWQNIFAYPGYVYRVQMSPNFASDRAVFLGGENGLYVSTDRGTTWWTWNEGFDALPYVSDLACSYGPGNRVYVFAGVYGEGVWMREYTGVGVEENPSSGLWHPASGIRITSNPFASFATIPGHETDRFSLYDISGRQVGVYRGDKIGGNLPSGVYFLKPQGLDSKPLRIVKIR
jgi:photosystem II stability/assembly factor-like uncharacterized protein